MGGSGFWKESRGRKACPSLSFVDQREARDIPSPQAEVREPNQGTGQGHRIPKPGRTSCKGQAEPKSPDTWLRWKVKGREGTYLGFLLLRLSAISLTAWGWDMTRLNPYCNKGKGQRKENLMVGKADPCWMDLLDYRPASKRVFFFFPPNHLLQAGALPALLVWQIRQNKRGIQGLCCPFT